MNENRAKMLQLIEFCASQLQLSDVINAWNGALMFPKIRNHYHDCAVSNRPWINGSVLEIPYQRISV